MAGRFSKRGKNPGAVDGWLDSLGYYRKNVAYDETCLFRAVSEQLYTTQINHEDVRRKCIKYGKNHSRDFQHIVPKKKDWFERLKKLNVHMVVCTDIEIQLVCNTYRVDIMVFNSCDHEIKKFNSHRFRQANQMLMLCKMSDDHYDAVYPKEHIINAGFCQAMVYKVLYEEVFGIPNVDQVVNSMLHDKQAPFNMYYSDTNQIKVENLEDDETVESDCTLFGSEPRQQNVLAPFPFKIAKALDPNMYRNIEYDTWLELRREMRLGEWYYGDDKLILGTRCIVTLGEEEFQCYIQTILEDCNCCEVYITKLAERLTVNYADLRPEDDAKPWPLPYRFARNQPLSSVGTIGLSDDRKSLRKRRERKRLQSFNEENPALGSKDSVSDVNVSNFEGCPLLMQDVTADMISLELSTPVQVSDCTSEPAIDQDQGACVFPDSIPWSDSPTSAEEIYQAYTNKIVTQSSSSLPYQDNNGGQLVYSYSAEATYSAMPVWPVQPQYMMSPDSVLSEDDVSPTSDYKENSQKYIYYQTDSAYGSPGYIPSPGYVPSPIPPPPPPPSLSFASFTSPYNDKIVCSTPITPVSPQVDVYPVLYPMSTPATPLYYSYPPPSPSAPISRPPEFVIPTPSSSLPIYSPPPVEMQYLSSPAYIYPPTPPVAWYNPPPHVNSQGFIFPTSLNNNNNGSNMQNVPNYNM